MENNTSHPVIVSDQREQAKSCTDVPHLDKTISASQNQKNKSFLIKYYWYKSKIGVEYSTFTFGFSYTGKPLKSKLIGTEACSDQPKNDWYDGRLVLGAEGR